MDTRGASPAPVRSVTVTIPPSDVPRLVTTASSGHAGSAVTQLRVNGTVGPAFEDDSGGGSLSSGYVIQPGEAPTLTFRLSRGAARGIRLGIALSAQVH